MFTMPYDCINTCYECVHSSLYTIHWLLLPNHLLSCLRNLCLKLKPEYSFHTFALLFAALLKMNTYFAPPAKYEQNLALMGNSINLPVHFETQRPSNFSKTSFFSHRVSSAFCCSSFCERSTTK